MTYWLCRRRFGCVGYDIVVKDNSYKTKKISVSHCYVHKLSYQNTTFTHHLEA